MRWPYPSQDQDPWFDAFETFIAEADASGYAAREDRNIFMGGGGFVTFTVSNGVLAWDAPLEIYSTIAGFRFNLAAGSVVIQDGQLFYVELVRYPTNNITLVPVVADRAPTSDNAFVIGIRRGSTVYFRFGASINDGDSLNIFEGGAGGSGTDTYEREATFSIPDGSSATTTATVGRITYAGSIIGLSLEITEAVASGTITVNIRRNGVVTLSTVLNTSFPTSRQITVASGTHAVVQNDAITVEVVAAAYDNVSGNNGGLTVVTTLLSGVSAAPPDIPDASNVQKGITRLSAVPAVANDPIAVGDNDPRVDTWTRSGTNVNLIHSGDVVHAGAIELDTAGTANYMQAEAGSTAAVSAVNTGRIRYNESLQRWEISSNGAAYVAVASGAGGVTLDGAYDFGGAGAGRTVTVDAGAVALNGNAADNNNVLEISKSPGGAQSGSGINVVLNANASGYVVRAVHDGLGAAPVAKGINLINTTAAAAGAQQASPDLVFSGQGWKTDATAGSQQVDFRLWVLPVQGTANPSAQLTIGQQINGGGFTSHTVLQSGSTTTAQMLGSDGASGTPFYSFASTPTQGMYRTGNEVRLRATTNVSFQIGSSVIVDVGNTYLRPATNNACDLGQSTFRWRDGWMSRQLNLDSTEADNNNVLIVSKIPAGAQSGSGASIQMGANATGYGLLVQHDGGLSDNTTPATAPKARGVRLVNPTAATGSVQFQSSPGVRFEGALWSSGAANSPRAFVQQLNPISDTISALQFWYDFDAEQLVVFAVEDTPAVALNASAPIRWRNSTTIHQSDASIGWNAGSGQLNFNAGTATVLWSDTATLFTDEVAGTVGTSSNRWDYFYGTHADLSSTKRSILVTGLTVEHANATTDMQDVYFNLARNISYVGSANDPEGGSATTIATHYAVHFTPPTFINSTTGGWGYKVQDAATLFISGAPVDGGTLVNLVNTYSLLVGAGTTRFNDLVRFENTSSVIGDVRFRSRTADPSTPVEGDLWYRSDTNVLKYYDGTTTNTISVGAGGGVTLDGAYDFGGAGAGRAITADSGAVTITNNAANGNNVLELTKSPASAQTGNGLDVTLGSNATGIGVNVAHSGSSGAGLTAVRVSVGTDPLIMGLNLQNNTNAAAGAQQASPDIFWRGAGWKTNATAASQLVDFRAFALPVQGAAAPSVNLVFKSRINGGSDTQQFAIKSPGQVNFRNLTADPTIDLAEGDAWYRSDLNAFYFYDGSAAQRIGGIVFTFSNGSESITATEHNLCTDTTTLTEQTDDCEVEIWVDRSAMIAGDEFEFRVHEDVNGTNTDTYYRWTGVQPGPYRERFIMGEGWFFSLKRISATSRTFNWSIRKLT